MSMTSDSGKQLNAAFSVVPDGDGLAVVLESSSGADRQRPNARNPDYRAALELLLRRLGALDAVLTAVLVDSSVVQRLSEEKRTLPLERLPLAECSDFHGLRKQLTQLQRGIGQSGGKASSGNATRRLRLRVDVPGHTGADAAALQARLARFPAKPEPEQPPTERPAPDYDVVWPTNKLLVEIRDLSTRSAEGRGLQESLTLLWALGRLTRGRARLTSWPEFEREVGDLLVEFGENRTPGHPFWHLASAPDLWETHGLAAIPTATDTGARAGFPALTSTALTKDRLLRTQVIAVLANAYLGDDAQAVLTKVGLGVADLDRPSASTTRVEQTALRSLLLDGRDAAPCALCGNEYPVESLVAAHIKRRSACTPEQKLDLANVAMLACALGCDHLYEQGHLTVAPDGRIRVADTTYPAVRARLAELDGRHVPAHTPESRDYFEWHSTTVFTKPVGPVG
ncbi:HNH endonuclease [Actinosynnema mirum]|uniref:ScoMcrA-like DNA sulfur-binding domain-containing protein n=1 Tax=Actinosynnema mirum (strain ATCC 29888 / DSM 43827 / JCM 3225 / NBRC 14064 / NCIMB 13271 / NRRL B-12336 / IMRU 3971 / 101) TaxID=446462 RepID=C6WB77_ACTMD|nr:HNH endonuclease [Actinosynnema mirum]ACU39368.1 hypothetical protein Amir_5550 [Actinosynnema mirum DSM 43827]